MLFVQFWINSTRDTINPCTHDRMITYTNPHTTISVVFKYISTHRFQLIFPLQSYSNKLDSMNQ